MSKSSHTKEYAKIIAHLKSARTERGLSQHVVAKRMRKPQSYISKIESGERRLDVAELKKFAEIYKQTVSYFFD